MIYKNLEAVYETYDSFLIDVYGVLYDGKKLYDGVLNILKKIKDSGRRIIILSNTTLVSEICKDRYAQFGLTDGVHYDQFMSSGEVFRRKIPEIFKPTAKYCQIFYKNSEIFEGSDLIEVDVNRISEADFVYVGGILEITGPGNLQYRRYPIDELRTKSGAKIMLEEVVRTNVADIEGFDNIADTLARCLNYGKQLVITNPDILAIEAVDGQTRPVLCQGGIGEFYEHMGGEVLYFGKPYLPIYEYVARFLEGCDRPAMIGDTPWTDILGGNNAGYSTILTLTGISEKFMSKMHQEELSTMDKVQRLIMDISPLMTHKQMRNCSQMPTQIIERLA
ncbi:MAG: HAD hydrolase-like protein [Holosporales bacterium]|jgi:HAD superfamily hydrolase (TIGR01450 family)|nr:HAD hydrolase-like protein [Holosporales bacterium]